MTTPAIKNKVLVTKDTLYHYRNFIAYGELDLTAGQVWDYDIAAALGADLPLYDLAKIEIAVYVKDTDPSSPTFDYFVDAGAVAASGFKDDGKVRVVNQHTATLTFNIHVIIHLKQV